MLCTGQNHLTVHRGSSSLCAVPPTPLLQSPAPHLSPSHPIPGGPGLFWSEKLIQPDLSTSPASTVLSQSPRPSPGYRPCQLLKPGLLSLQSHQELGAPRKPRLPPDCSLSACATPIAKRLVSMPLLPSAALSKLLPLSVPPCHLLRSGHNLCLISQGDSVHVTHLAQCLAAPGKCLLNGNCYCYCCPCSA